MAILNSLLRGQLKGRIGNQWFAHAKNAQGRPVTRTGTINSSPNNPQTYDQMMRRAKFANAVKFYKHAQQNFFKFAFEDKKANETDYNAFMRYNIDRSILLPKEFVEDANFPAYSFLLNTDKGVLARPWLLTNGSLPRQLQGQGSSIYCASHSSDDTGLTIELKGGFSFSNLCTWFQDNMGAQMGDIITIVVISLPDNWIGSSNGVVEFQHPENSSMWATYQFIIDLNNYVDSDAIAWRPRSGNAKFEDLGKGVVCFCAPGTSSELCAFLTITRKVAGKLRAVSSQFYRYIESEDLLSDYYNTHTEEEILESWYANDQDILQGGVADPTGSGTSEGKITRAVAGSSKFDFSKLQPSSTYNIRCYGSNCESIQLSDFSGVNCTPMAWTAESSRSGSLVFKTGSSAGDYSINFGEVTIFEGSIV